MSTQKGDLQKSEALFAFLKFMPDIMMINIRSDKE